MMNLEQKQDQVYQSGSHQELATHYDQWASTYDHDLVDNGNYIAPQKVVSLLSNYLSQTARILDAGAGTGLTGEVLRQSGYPHIVAMDLSIEMLQQARSKNIYTSLHQGVMGEELDFPTNSFDGVVCVGVFTYGHAPSHSFDELIRITKPGGYILFTLRLDFFETSDFPEKLDALETSKAWKLSEKGEKFSPISTAQPGGYYQIWVYQIL